MGGFSAGQEEMRTLNERAKRKGSTHKIGLLYSSKKEILFGEDGGDIWLCGVVHKGLFKTNNQYDQSTDNTCNLVNREPCCEC